ncbi:MAG: sterol desaturase family protein [Flavobacteriaceae bacterium]|nr:sterol desaturase family protein [Flavobacteriaceae bacterium]
MESLIIYFESIPSQHRALILAGGLTLFWILEGAVPLFNYKYNKWKHAIPNLCFTFSTIIINFVLATFLIKISDWTVANDFGVINWMPEMPLWIYVTIGILLMDFIGAYLVHYVEHKVSLLWMVHLVHHTDHKVDTTTANRHHPLESLIRYAFTLFGVFIIGAPIGIIMLYQSMSLIATQFSHANIKLPKSLDKAISYILISPDMHKIHHHYVLPYTDSNYGNIFSIWDRLFGTYMYMDRNNLVYGVDVFPDEKKNGELMELLKQPFKSYQRPTIMPDDD